MKSDKLKTFLESIYKRYHDPQYLCLDPLILVRNFSNTQQQELWGMIAAVMAYGRVELICRGIEKIIEITGKDICCYISSTSFKKKNLDFNSFKYRFNEGGDIALLLEAIKEALADYGSLQNLFISLISSLKPDNSVMKTGLHGFTRYFINKGRQITGGDLKPSFLFLLPSPLSGSPCKRLNMYLRWMVRPDDGIDLGIWKGVSTGMLVMPMDTHVARISRQLCMLKKKSVDWSAAEEVTSILRSCDPADPVRYDFSLCHYGMMTARKEALCDES